MSDPIHNLRLPLAQVPDPLALPPPRTRGQAPFAAALRPPGSKSLSNRALLLAALCPGQSVVRNALTDADDAQRMIAALRELGATVEVDGLTVRVTGVAGRWKSTRETTLNLNNAGTATRFLTAAALLSPAPIIIDGNARMRQRPIGELGEILEQLGVKVDYLGSPGCPPIRLTPPAELPTSASLSIPTTQSSQFISALLLVAPWLPGGLTVKLDGEITSGSYIDMTVGLLQRLGATVRTSGDLRIIRVGHAASLQTGISPFDYAVEPDASGATYLWAAATLVPDATCKVLGLSRQSLQGDANFTELLSRAGAEISEGVLAATGPTPAAPNPFIQAKGPLELAPVMADMADMPDAAMTLAVVASFAKGTSVLRGLKTLRVKESDRIAAMQAELGKIGVKVESPVAGDGGAMRIEPPKGGVDCSPNCAPVYFDTYDDHRIAMSLALVALRRPNVFINHPQCVAKTYPNFWDHFAQFVG